MHVKVRINSTEHLPSIRQSDALNQHPEHWRKLQSTLEIARFLSPEIEEWVRDRYANNAIFIDPSTDATLRVNATLNRLYIGSSFWQYSDGEKAAALAHEYAHYKQGPVKHAKVRISQLLSATVSDYNNELEREAFLYHREALEALRLQESRSYYSVMEMLREFGQIHRQGH